MDPIGQGRFSLEVNDITTKKIIGQGDQVNVGNAMEIVVSADDAITEFFLAECTATNKKDAPDKSLDLIGGISEAPGCMNDLGEGLSTSINATSPNPGHTITFNQFGFADTSGGKLF